MNKEKVILSKDQIESYHRQGFLSIDKLTNQKDVAHLREIYDHLFKIRAGREIGDQFDLAGTDEEKTEASLPQILDPAKYAPEINESKLLANASSAVKQLLGAEATCGFAHAILKPARVGAEAPWHQDAAYWDPALRYTSLSIWVPLQEVTEENGCMHFIPGSHKLDVVRHQSINNNPRIHGLELIPEERQYVRNVASCPIPAAGATFHDAYMMHHTPANKSNTNRRGLILNGSLPATPRLKPLSFPWMDEKITAREIRVKGSKEGK